MAEFKEIMARKIWECYECGRKILKGEYYWYTEWRAGNYDELDVQTGIEYMKFRICKECDGSLKKGGC